MSWVQIPLLAFVKYFYINNIKFNYNLELKNNVKNDLPIDSKFSFTVI